MIEDTHFKCECGNYIITNDPYMLAAWDEWHEEGAFLAGSYHRRIDGYDISEARAELTKKATDAMSGERSE